MARYPQSTLASCEIPWDENENLIEDLFRKQVRLTLKRGFNNLYIFGSAGEGYAIDTARFREIVQVFYEETRGGDIHPVVGVIGLSTANIVERVGLAHDIGFRTFQIVLPSWGVLNDDEVVTFFKDACGSFPDSQFLHYNLARAKRILGGRDYRRVIDVVPNLVATKSTAGGLEGAADLMRHSAELQHFMGETNFPHGCMYGECSLLATYAFMSPHQIWEVFEAGRAINSEKLLDADRAMQVEKLFKLQHQFHDIHLDLWGQAPGSLQLINGAREKIIVRLGGLEEMPLRLLSPYQSCSEEEYQACKRVMCEKRPDWIAVQA